MYLSYAMYRQECSQEQRQVFSFATNKETSAKVVDPHTLVQTSTKLPLYRGDFYIIRGLNRCKFSEN